jgi:hypothetical protein
MAVISPTGLLGTRSPILITWNGTGSSASDIYYFKLEIYAWTGDKDVRPASPTYTIDRTSGFVDAFPTADIAPILENEFNQRVSKLDTEDLVTMSPDALLWVEVDYDIEYLSGGFVVNDTGTTTRFLIADGYSKFTDGSNKDLGQAILIEDQDKYFYEFDTYNMPIYLGDVGSSYQTDVVKIKLVGSNASNDTIVVSNQTGEEAEDRVLLFPVGIPNLSNYIFTEGLGLSEPRLLDWWDVQILDSSDAVVDSRRFYNQCEPKYTPIQLQYINRYGMWDTMTFFKRSDTDLDVSKESYRSVIGSASASGYTWGTQARGIRSYNEEMSKKITMNTGFIEEVSNENIEQLLMSPYVLMTINRATTRVQDTYTISQDFRAVNVLTESLRLQKHINEKTINYTIQVEFATPDNAML